MNQNPAKLTEKQSVSLYEMQLFVESKGFCCVAELDKKTKWFKLILLRNEKPFKTSDDLIKPADLPKEYEKKYRAMYEYLTKEQS